MTESELKIIDEIHAIREKINEETKDMTTEEYIKHINAEAIKFIEKHNMKIVREENINGYKIVRNSE